MLLSERRLRRILGVIWVVDGLLQLQPHMFGMNMINGIMGPMINSQPGLIARNLAWITSVTQQNLFFVNVLVASVQISIGVLLVTGYWVRQAIVGSALWALVVWYGGEGMSMLLTGQGGILTGAPGAVLLYPLIGFAVYPREAPAEPLTPEHYPTLLSRRALTAVLGCLWMFLGLLQLQPYWWQQGQIAQTMRSMTGNGGWDGVLVDPSLNGMASVVAHSEILVNSILAAVCFTIGLALLLFRGPKLRWALGASIVVSLAVWWFAEAVGMIFSGMSTDFNSGLLLILLALACWPQGAWLRATAAWFDRRYGWAPPAGVRPQTAVGPKPAATGRGTMPRTKGAVIAVLVAGAAAVGAMAALSIYPGLPAQGERPVGASVPPAASFTRTVKPYRLSLRLAPGTVGPNQASLIVTDGGRRVVPGQVQLIATMVEMNMGTQFISMKPARRGTYRGSVLISMSGQWQLVAVVYLHSGRKLTVTFRPRL